MQNRARVDARRRLVAIFHTGLQCWEVYKITKDGRVSKRTAPETAFKVDIREAFRSINYPLSGFKTVQGSHKAKAETWSGLIEKIWGMAKA